MIYKILFVEVKNPDWVVTSLEGVDGTKAENVSINRTNKKGETFPKFDEIQSGREVEGELWRSDAGKFYLFAPKIASQFVPKKGNIAALMEKKTQTIQNAQDNKAEGIKISSTIRMAVDCAIAEKEAGQFNDEDREVLSYNLKKGIKEWREYLWNEWDNTDGFIPFNK